MSSDAIHLAASLSDCKSLWLLDLLWVEENLRDILHQSGITVKMGNVARWNPTKEQIRVFLFFEDGYLSFQAYGDRIQLDVYIRGLDRNEMETLLSRIVSRMEATEVHRIFLKRGRFVKLIKT